MVTWLAAWLERASLFLVRMRKKTVHDRLRYHELILTRVYMGYCRRGGKRLLKLVEPLIYPLDRGEER